MTDVAADLDALARADEVEIAVHLGGLDGVTWFERDAERTFPAASTMKVAVVEALHRSGLDLRERVPVRAVLPSAVRGETYETTRDYDNDDEPWRCLGGLVRLDWLAERAVVRSSNLAANLLLDRLGLHVADAVYTGIPGCHLRRPIQDAPAVAAGRENTVTAAGLSQVLTTLSPATEALLERCVDPGLAPALPPGTAFAHKPGWFDGVCHDHGVARPARGEPFVISILTRAGERCRLDPDGHLRLLQDAARLVCTEDR